MNTYVRIIDVFIADLIKTRIVRLIAEKNYYLIDF